MNTLRKNAASLFLAFLALSAFAIISLSAWSQVHADVTLRQPEQVGSFVRYNFFATSTLQTVLSTSTIGIASSTSIFSWINNNGEVDPGYMNIAGAKQVTLYFSRSATSTNNGSSSFTVWVTPNGTNWYPFSLLMQNQASSTSSTATVASISIASGTSTTMASMDLRNFSFMGVACISNIVTDGANSCSATASW